MLRLPSLISSNLSTVTKPAVCCFSTSSLRLLDQKWRDEKGLPKNPNEYGPLTNLPDYTFLDGRPTPLGSNQKRRVLRQREIANKIVELSKELEYAKERYAKTKAAEAEEKERILHSKLKPKGHLLLKKDESS